MVLTKNQFNSIVNFFMCSKIGHPFLKLIINNLINYKDKYWFLGKHINVLYSTGRNMLDNIYKKYYSNDIFFISYETTLGNCAPYCGTNINDVCNSYLIGHNPIKASWNKFDSILFNHLYCNTKNYIILILILIIIIIYYFGFIKSCRIKCK
jgi:mannosyltransferase OCH1-like enzyme